MLDPRSDRLFKHIFHNQPKSLMHLLNSFLPLTKPIVGLEYLPEELHDDVEEGRLGIVDVRCMDSEGRHFIVEMQVRRVSAMLHRMVWNAARIISRQQQSGGSFLMLQPVYTLCLLQEHLVPGSSEWMHHYTIDSNSIDAPRIDLMHFTFVELGKWAALRNFNKSSHRDAWLLFLTQPEAMYQAYTPEELATLEELHAAVNAWDLTKYTREQLRAMDKKIDRMMLREAIAYDEYMEAKAEGISIGISVFNRLSGDPTVSNEDLMKEFGLTELQIQEMRVAFRKIE